MVDAHQKRLLTKVSWPDPKPVQSKYRNSRTVHNGELVDSSKEARRRNDLELMQKSGAITDLQYGVRFDFVINGILVCWYKADAVYKVNGQRVVEDTKSAPTRKNREYRIKAKLMRAVHGIEITEV